MTFVEFKVRTLFKTGDIKAPAMGFRNQCVFAATFLVWGLYHFFSVTPITEANELFGPSGSEMIMSYEKIFYLTVGVVAAMGQMWVGFRYLHHGKKMITGKPPVLPVG